MSFPAVVFQSWLVGNSLPFNAFVTSAENMSFMWECEKRSAAKSDENIIVEEERSIKAAQKDPSATVVASVRSTGTAVLGSVNAT